MHWLSRKFCFANDVVASSTDTGLVRVIVDRKQLPIVFGQVDLPAVAPLHFDEIADRQANAEVLRGAVDENAVELESSKFVRPILSSVEDVENGRCGNGHRQLGWL
jgi:hypothetical protein